MPGQKPEAKLLRLYSIADSFTIGYLRRYLILEKGSTHKIYIGSGTSVNGCRSRMLQHKRRDVDYILRLLFATL